MPQVFESDVDQVGAPRSLVGGPGAFEPRGVHHAAGQTELDSIGQPAPGENRQVISLLVRSLHPPLNVVRHVFPEGDASPQNLAYRVLDRAREEGLDLGKVPALLPLAVALKPPALYLAARLFSSLRR